MTASEEPREIVVRVSADPIRERLDEIGQRREAERRRWSTQIPPHVPHPHEVDAELLLAALRAVLDLAGQAAGMDPIDGPVHARQIRERLTSALGPPGTPVPDDPPAGPIRLRQGRATPVMLHHQLGEQPSDADPAIGMATRPAWAARLASGGMGRWRVDPGRRHGVAPALASAIRAAVNGGPDAVVALNPRQDLPEK